MGNDFKVLPEGLLESPLWGKGRVRFASKTLGRSATQVGAWYRPDDGKVPARLLWLDRIDAKDRDEMAHRWHLLVSDPESEEFVRVLERLVQSRILR